MRIGLLSDTHIPQVEKELPSELMEAFRGVDLILHAGDIYVPAVLDDLQHMAPVLAARGDDDFGDILTDKRVKEKHILKLEGQTLCLVHERPYIHDYLLNPLRWHSRLSLEQEERDDPDIVVFGHEHVAVVRHVGNTLYINPGSPTFLNYCHGLGTVGMLEIGSGKPNIRVLQL